MSTTTERKVTVASGLGDADASQVMAGATFSSESGFKQEGKFIPSAGNITYNNATSGLGSTNTQGAIDEIVTLTNESGHSIDVTLNKSTYVMTISLKDKNGEVLNEKTVDFPMETAFVNASYDKASKTMKFTLESGSTVDVPLGDLVEGLVSQTDFNVLSGEVETLKTEVENNTNAISEINDSLSALGKCKNLLKTTLGSGNGNGITYINNGDGTYTLNGTCTNTFELHFNPTLKLPYGKYKLLGTSAFQKDNNGSWKATLASGDIFEVSESKPVLDVIAYITSGSVVSKTFKPMVTTNLNATVDDFVPYTGDGDTLTEDVAKVKNDVNVLKNDKEDKYTLELNNPTKCVYFKNVVNTDEYFEAMVFDRSDKKKYIKVSGYRPSENAEENEISYINLGSKTLKIVGSNNQAIMFSGGSEVYDAYIKAIR